MQNPVNTNRPRRVTFNTSNTSARSRAISDNVLSSPRSRARRRAPSPTAPPRPRSPSPTEGYTAPNHLVCPIQMTVFHDPVVASDGHTYERSAIVNWLRTNTTSPVTRQAISKDTLNPNLLIKQLAEEFRDKCRQRRAMYPYRLDIDLKKTDRIDDLSTPTKIFYHVEWCGENRNLTNSDVILVHLIGDQAEKIADINCKLAPHPNVIRTSGRVEHQETGILLLQDNLPEQTLEHLLEQNDGKLSICTIDTILYQLAFALQHLASQNVVHGNINMKNIYIDQLDPIPENIKIKLANIAENDDTTDDGDDLVAFARLAQQLYLSPVVGHNDDCDAREEFLGKLISNVDGSQDRFTFTQVTDMIVELIRQRKFDFPCSFE